MWWTSPAFQLSRPWSGTNPWSPSTDANVLWLPTFLTSSLLGISFGLSFCISPHFTGEGSSVGFCRRLRVSTLIILHSRTRRKKITQQNTPDLNLQVYMSLLWLAGQMTIVISWMSFRSDQATNGPRHAGVLPFHQCSHLGKSSSRLGIDWGQWPFYFSDGSQWSSCLTKNIPL